jgi:hypothetical protein
MQTYGLLEGGGYEICHWDGLSCHDMHTRFPEKLVQALKLEGGGIHRDTEKNDLISLILFFSK